MLPQKFFLSLIDKHFPPHHKLHKLFNRNNVKISYSCLPNIKSIINAHNRKVLYLSPTIGRRTYSTSSKRCSLCLNEKLKILLHRDCANTILNVIVQILCYYGNIMNMFLRMSLKLQYEKTTSKR